MNEKDEVCFDMDENMGSYYDFNLLDLLDNNEDTVSADEGSKLDKMCFDLR